MSNPAVIILSKSAHTKNKFVVEDNIGESIHLHYNDLRIDLNTKEFLNLEKVIENSLEELIDIKNFELKYFDPSFIQSISSFLPDLKKVTIENIEIEKLIIQRQGFLSLPVLKPINQSRVLRALRGDKEENNSYNQINLFGKSNHERVKDINDLIRTKGYPYNDKYIILFNNQNIIRDGQHRASSLIYNGFKGDIPIIRFHFKNSKYNVPKRPWIKVFHHAIMAVIRRIIGRIYRIIKKFVG
ncbi:hypothetical protein LX95_00107 [Mesonia algae]|uniref:Uncharacterized protein n=1 Tax=Mesonia algae TaxID=213248 RepID=A0A2W7IYM9_9FLAO|nr:hypothetical protein [Mesonia algae]PZW43783.1 hypothetical protein LX95_00107 [Mesonia algae]